ncbi:MAG: ArsC/Spx/MgsR family protein [Myxococcota bacterium]|nr:ArsC/Spx/MgsR family protein [Myxococcota bacterium]
MAGVTLYHNPGCSKSRGALEILRESGVDHDVVEYLTDHPSREDLERILALLPDPPSELVRKDKRFAELGLAAEDYEKPAAVIDLLLEHPELMQRPIAVRAGSAVIGRPSERIREILGDDS